MLIFKLAINVINVLANAVYYFLVYSSKIGEAILLGVGASLTNIQNILYAAFCVLQDFYKFIHEFKQTLEVITQYVGDITNDGINLVLEGVTGTKLLTLCLATMTGKTVEYFAEMLRTVVFLVADSCWSAITFLPKTIFRLVIALGDFTVFALTGTAKMTVTMAFDFMNNLCRWMVGVGLITIFIVYWRYVLLLLIYYLRALYDSISEIMNVRYYVAQFKMFLNRLRPKRKWFRSSRRRSSSDDFYEGDGMTLSLVNTSLCVACCDRSRNIVLLPCRHLCLCEECKDYMFFVTENHNCPICRSRVDHNMSVYL